MPALENIERWALVAKLVQGMQEKRGWAGETHIQKTLFFLKHLLQVPVGYTFVLYKHGPYSFDLHDDLGVMLAHFILNTEPRSGYGASFGIGDTGETVMERGRMVVDQYEDQLRFTVDALGTKDVRTLERYGTALLVKEIFFDFKDEVLAEKIVELKPHIPSPLALEAVHEVSKIEKDAESRNLIIE